MIQKELLALVQSDAECLALAIAGSDDAAARRASEIAPKALTGKLWSYRGLSSAVSPYVVSRLIRTVDLFIESDHELAPLVKEMREFLRADGIDISNPTTLTMLNEWAESPLPLSVQDLTAIIDAASERPTISSIEITNLGLFNPVQS